MSARRIAVVGASGVLGSAILARLGSDAVGIARRSIADAGWEQRIVDDYAAIPADTLRGCDAIINCVGTATGDSANLQRINVTVAANLALSMLAADVRRLVHISSFSVYGAAERIDRDIATAPVDAYGRSKLAADRALGAHGAMLDVAILRLPAIVGREGRSKLKSILGAWRRLGVMPVAADAARSMISLDGAAQAAIALAHRPGSADAVWLVADPLAVSLSEIAQMSRSHHGKLLRTIVLPSFGVALARRLSPGIAGRMFGSSQLVDHHNSFDELHVTSRLSDVIHHMIDHL